VSVGRFVPFAEAVACAACDARLTIQPQPGTGEWVWVDDYSQTTGLDPDLGHLGSMHPWVELDRLAALALAGDAAAGRAHDDLMVRLSTGGTRHVHVPVERPPYVGPPVPRTLCCGSPRRLTVRGWRCTICHTDYTPSTPEES
jgi:hypothetical protein